MILNVYPYGLFIYIKYKKFASNMRKIYLFYIYYIIHYMDCKLCDKELVKYHHTLYKCKSCSTIYNFYLPDFKRVDKKMASVLNKSLIITNEQVFDHVIMDRFIPESEDNLKKFSTISIFDIFNDTTSPYVFFENCIKYLKDEDSYFEIFIDYNLLWFMKNKNNFSKMIYKQRNYFSFIGLLLFFSKFNMFISDVYTNETCAIFKVSFNNRDYTLYDYINKELEIYNDDTWNKWKQQMKIYNNFTLSLIMSHEINDYNIVIDKRLQNFANMIEYDKDCVSLEEYVFFSDEKYLIFTNDINFTSNFNTVIV